MVMQIGNMTLDLSNLTVEERSTILSVLNKDDELRHIQEEKISELKAEINAMRLQSVMQEETQGKKTCSRCQTTFGWLLNTGQACPSCNYRVCKKCRIALLSRGWVCIMCYKQNQLRWLNGEWLQYAASTLLSKNEIYQSAPDLVRASLRTPNTNDVCQKDLSPAPAVYSNVLDIIADRDRRNTANKALAVDSSYINFAKNVDEVGSNFSHSEKKYGDAGLTLDQLENVYLTIDDEEYEFNVSVMSAVKRSASTSNLTQKRTKKLKPRKYNTLKSKSTQRLNGTLKGKGNDVLVRSEFIDSFSPLVNSLEQLKTPTIEDKLENGIENQRKVDVEKQINDEIYHENNFIDSKILASKKISEGTSHDVDPMIITDNVQDQVSFGDVTVDGALDNSDGLLTEAYEMPQRDLPNVDHDMKDMDTTPNTMNNSQSQHAAPLIVVVSATPPIAANRSLVANEIGNNQKDSLSDEAEGYRELVHRPSVRSTPVEVNNIKIQKPSPKPRKKQTTHFNAYHYSSDQYDSSEQSPDRGRASYLKSGLFSHLAGSVESLTGSLYSQATGTGYGVVKVTGAIYVGLTYRDHELYVDVKQCSDLAAADIKKSRSDPYVKCYLSNDMTKTGKRKTAVRKRTLNPVFNECWMFRISQAELLKCSCILSVWHSDRLSRNIFLGEVTIPMSSHDFTDETPFWLSLHDSKVPLPQQLKDAGQLELSIMLNESAEDPQKPSKTNRDELLVHIIAAKDLVSIRSSGSANSFCKGYLLPDKNSKQKTTIVKKSLNPVWDNTFSYKCQKHLLPQRCLELTVWDHDRVSSNDFLGGVRLNLGSTAGGGGGGVTEWCDAREDEAHLWRLVIEHPGVEHRCTLPLRSHMQPLI